MAETIQVDDESWSEVIVTLAISTATSAIFLSVYEIARRNPSLVEVFDRRRATKPNRTPPPLLRNSIFEWLFLSNDPTYSQYTDLAFMRDVIQEKRKQRNPGKQRWFASWRNSITPRSKKKKDEDQKNKQQQQQQQQKHEGDEESVISPQNRVKNVIEFNTSGHGVEMINVDRNYNDHPSASRKSNKTGRYSSSTGHSSKENSKKIVIRQHLTPDVVEVNGWRLPREVGEYALANDLTEEQLYDYEGRLLEQERLDEIEFQCRRREMTEECSNEKPARSFLGDINRRLDDATLEELEGDVKLQLPPRRSRIWFFGFQHFYVSSENSSSASPGRPNTAGSTESQRASRLGKPVALLRNVLTARFKMNSAVNLYAEDGDTNVHLNRHLKSVSVLRKRPLSASDSELLRCIGLDTFVMIRFLRFCFDITFLPFVAACIILFPVYGYNNFEGEIENGEGTVKTQTEGYFLLTINRLEPASSKLWICWGYTFFYILFILRRLWIEWEIFLPLRFDFLANGDVDDEKSMKHANYKSRAVVPPQNDFQLHLEQYRNSCLVEYIPDSHRRDQELFQFFEAVFPGQVKRAELLLNATELTNLMKKRQALLEKYEKIYAKFSYEKKRHWQKKEGNFTDLDSSSWECLKCRSCRDGLKKPKDPTMKLGKSNLFCCGKKVVKALPHILAEIKSLNRRIETEFKKVAKDKQLVEDREEHNDLFHKTVDTAKAMLTGKGDDLMCDTGFVEFMSLTAKQSALQCNITGTNGFMVLASAPDPRDIIWDNATVEKQSIIVKNAQFSLILFTGTLFWFAVVGFVTSLSNLDEYRISLGNPAWFPDEDSIIYDLIEGYVPVILLESLMLIVPFTLHIVAKNFIRLKTHSEIDQFIYKWHFAYRVTNLISIIVRQQVLKTLDLFLTSPRSTIDYLAGSITLSSQFFLNNMLVAAGTETFFELSQLTKIFRHFIINRFITLESTSKRELERMQEPISLEWGEKIPPFIFALLVASIYSTVVPIVMGACALYFYIAAKIYTHQALFIYAQPYEGGGKLMYLLNRSVFGIVYISICFFAAILGLKNAGIASATGFLVLMLIITYVVDMWITTTFVNPSITLALTNARIIDEETKERNERKRLYREFRNEKKRKKREQANVASRFQSNQNYLPNQLLASLPENEVKMLTKESGSNFNEDYSSGLQRTGSSNKGLGLSPTSSMEDNDEKVTDDFYLYRQPQLNKTSWETKPRIDNW